MLYTLNPYTSLLYQYIIKIKFNPPYHLLNQYYKSYGHSNTATPSSLIPSRVPVSYMVIRQLSIFSVFASRGDNERLLENIGCTSTKSYILVNNGVIANLKKVNRSVLNTL